MSKRRFPDMTSMGLHILAMLLILCDHLWGTVIAGNDWLTCLGRMAYPIFAFMIVEGFFYTHDLKKYVGRLLLFAILSEIPFNLAVSQRVFYPVHQNVLFTFLIAIGLMFLNEKAKSHGKCWLRWLVGILTVALGYILGLIAMVDYYHAGVLTVLVFYFFRERKWWSYIGQALCLWYINAEMLGGFTYEFALFGRTWFVARQSLALLALIPIWLYRGRQGPHNRALQIVYYAFYPVHLSVLGLLALWL